MDPRLLKKPKPEPDSDDNATVVDYAARLGGGRAAAEEDEETDEDVRREHEEALVVLIDQRCKERELILKKMAYYKSQLDEVEMKLTESKTKLERLRSSSARARTPHLAACNANGIRSGPDQPPPKKKKLLIPSVNLKCPALETTTSPEAVSAKEVRNNLDKHPNHEADSIYIPAKRASLEPSEDVRLKRKLDEKQHKDLISKICSRSSPSILQFQYSNHVPSEHKRKLRCLELSPVDDHLFATSALDGAINLWKIQEKGSCISLLRTSDGLSSRRRWPEDLTWHPDGDRVFAAYSADNDDSQISVFNLNTSSEEKVTFSEEKPHLKGLINCIHFMPWTDVCFTTGGSDHAVVLWQERRNSWNSKIIHGNLHSSSVMGVAGLHQRKTILSAGTDKRIIAFDLLAERSEFKHQIDSKCMSVLPNPSDFNLFMVQTGFPCKQLQLYDFRLRCNEVHIFGWKQESSESQSALINQAWSPDGLYISSGSADPKIHIFDIRYNSSTPSQTMQAHQRRVFKAAWHRSLPLLTSISSDLNIGLHRIL